MYKFTFKPGYIIAAAFLTGCGQLPLAASAPSRPVAVLSRSDDMSYLSRMKVDERTLGGGRTDEGGVHANVTLSYGRLSVRVFMNTDALVSGHELIDVIFENARPKDGYLRTIIEDGKLDEYASVAEVKQIIQVMATAEVSSPRGKEVLAVMVEELNAWVKRQGS